MSGRWRILLGGVFAVAYAAALCSPFAPVQAATLSSVATGDVLQGERFSTLYFYAADGMRYVFPNEKTYFTWYDDFSDVKHITDEDLARIQIGGNVTYKPGVQMIKIDTDPKTYAVDEHGTLRWIETEQVATILYGADWATHIDDLPDAFFANYILGVPIDHPDDFIVKNVLSSTTDINDDKGIEVPETITITTDGYTPIDVTIEAGRSVRFINDDTRQHTVTAENLLWGSGTIAPGGEFVHTFESAGTYPFFDSYNSRNSGAVYVTSHSE